MRGDEAVNAHDMPTQNCIYSPLPLFWKEIVTRSAKNAVALLAAG